MREGFDPLRLSHGDFDFAWDLAAEKIERKKDTQVMGTSGTGWDLQFQSVSSVATACGV